ncbi:hypothetical protein Ddye_013519 [Dipteronia dyeriana]|uniref:hAT-like transposase RNase-H fold domain-containing protein n=1 Tax=Dipteronia dyeriana TaxID=168575 RepID=A0AAD9X6R2_9ROSI|nr:hypothetical protein Ddye_013519 [Dipteronia dyeriana]
MSDGWKDMRGRRLINFLVNDLHGTMLLKSVDDSDAIKDATILFCLLDLVVEEVGEDPVVQVVKDNNVQSEATFGVNVYFRGHDGCSWVKSWEKKPDGREIKKIILRDGSFWGAMSYALKTTRPLVLVLMITDSEQLSAMRFIYDAIDKAKEEIVQSLGIDEGAYKGMDGNIFNEREKTMINLICNCLIGHKEIFLEDDGHYGLYFSELDSGKKRAGPPKDDDWGNAKVFVQFLHVFYDITLKFSDSLSVTSDMFFHELSSIATELDTLANNGDFLLCEMTVAMKSKFDKYWGKIVDDNKLLKTALVLDPRYKLDYVKKTGDLFDENRVNKMIYDIKELLIKLCEFYNGVDNISSGDQVSRSIPLENEGDMGKFNENVDFRLERLKKFKKMKEKKDFIDLKNEVERDWNDYFLG